MDGEKDVFTTATPPAAGVASGPPTSNPAEFVSRFGVTDEQKKNIETVLVGTGSGLIYRALTPVFGEVIAGMIGGGVSGAAAKQLKKLMKGGS